MSETLPPDRRFFHGDNQPHELGQLPDPPPWRRFDKQGRRDRGARFQVGSEAVELVNAALLLRRPLLITGKPGTGKSSLAYAVAHELRLGRVLVWPITTRSTLQQGLYTYDAIARLQDASLAVTPGDGAEKPAAEAPDIGRYIRLGPLGTALLPSRKLPSKPRVLLIDEIDKSDVDLPNDLLHVFEEGEFEIPELARLPREKDFDWVRVQRHGDNKRAWVRHGRVRCNAFPFVLMTSNGERAFPPAFLRRCLRLQMNQPTETELTDIVRARLMPPDGAVPDKIPSDKDPAVSNVIREFLKERDGELGGLQRELATDQLLNAVYLLGLDIDPLQREQLRKILWQPLSGEA